MRLVSGRPARCERAREWISLAVDGELSPFEQSLLAGHLERCEECAVFHADIAGIARDLRAASLERIGCPVDLPSRSRRPLRRMRLGGVTSAAAVALVALVLGGTMGSRAMSGPAHHSDRARPAYLDSVQYELHLMRHTPPPPLYSGGGHAV